MQISQLVIVSGDKLIDNGIMMFHAKFHRNYPKMALKRMPMYGLMPFIWPYLGRISKQLYIYLISTIDFHKSVQYTTKFLVYDKIPQKWSI